LADIREFSPALRSTTGNRPNRLKPNLIILVENEKILETKLKTLLTLNTLRYNEEPFRSGNWFLKENLLIAEVS